MLTVIGALVLIGAVGDGMNSNKQDESHGAKPAAVAEGSNAAPPSETDAPGQGQSPEQQAAPQEEVPAEFTSALKKAESYSKTMPMSKLGIYDQLTSQFEQFSPEAA